MSRAPSDIRKEARRLFLSGEMDTNSEIAAHLKVKPHTVGRWRKEEGWDEVRRKAERFLAEKQAKSINSKVVSTNNTHLKAWDIILGQLVETLYKPDPVRVKMLDSHQDRTDPHTTQPGQFGDPIPMVRESYPHEDDRSCGNGKDESRNDHGEFSGWVKAAGQTSQSGMFSRQGMKVRSQWGVQLRPYH